MNIWKTIYESIDEKYFNESNKSTDEFLQKLKIIQMNHRAFQISQRRIL